MDELCLRTLDGLLEGCQVIGRDYRYLYVNEALTRHARQTRESLLGRRMSDVYPGIEQTPVFAVITRVMQGGVPEHLDNAFTFPDGKIGYFELSIQPVPDGVCVLSIDITARVEAQRLAQRQQRLESLGTLAGGVAHDLNNALAPILMSIGLLRELGGTDDDLLLAVEDSAARAAKLVRQLLMFSKGTDGARVLLWPQAIVRDVERFVSQAFPKNIRTEYHLAPDLPPVLGDATQLGQVLLNLSINARDAMPDGGHLRIRTGRARIDDAYASAVLDGKPGDFVTIEVRDTGSGIPAAVLDRIFEPFFTTKGPELGTGLGLSTSLGIVRSHGGFIHVYSEPDKGTTFRVYLPVADVTDHAVETEDLPQVQGRGRLVLVIDDDDRARGATASALGSLGFQVVTARDGAEGLIHLADLRSAVSLALVDLHMPGVDGWSFLTRLQKIRPHLPVVVMSGHPINADELALAWSGAAILPKPFTKVELAQRVVAALSVL